MPYTLHKLAPGSYDLKLDGDLVGGVVKNGPRAAKHPMQHGQPSFWQSSHPGRGRLSTQ